VFVNLSKHEQNNINYYYPRLAASFPGQPGQADTRKVKTSLDFDERRDDGGFGMAVASAGPYANNLHLAPDR